MDQSPHMHGLNSDGLGRGQSNHMSYRPNYELVASSILNYITAAGLRPGDRLPSETELASMFGVGRTVAREAVKMLSALGRLSVRKGVGIIVTEPTSPLLYEWVANFLPGNLDQVNMLFELRRTLETEAARLAALRASPSQVLDIATAVEHCEAAAKADDFSAFRQSDEEFHRSVVVASHNSFLVTLVVVVTQLKSQVLTIGLHGQSSGSLILAANQHRLISEAIVSAQPEQAVSAMLEHIDVNFKQYQQAIQRWIAMSDGSTI